MIGCFVTAWAAAQCNSQETIKGHLYFCSHKQNTAAAAHIYKAKLLGK